MFFDAATGTVISNCWVDGAAIWFLDLDSRKERLVPVEGSKYVGIDTDGAGLIRLVHHGMPEVSITIRSTSEPEKELASLWADGAQARFRGDSSLWSRFDSAVIAHSSSGSPAIMIDASNESILWLDVSWFTDSEYDLGFQQVMDCHTLLHQDLILVSIQRGSDLVVVDPVVNKRIGVVRLAQRGGNPSVTQLNEETFIASDYDSLCLVDARSLQMTSWMRLQEANAPMSQLFIGEYDYGPKTCAVARPYSGDALLLDSCDLSRLAQAEVGGQPMAICMVSDQDFVTRDWRTGKAEFGRFG